MALTGPYRELEQLRRNLSHVASPQFRLTLSETLCQEALHQAEIGFDRAVDPYDHPWAPLKYRKGKTLVDEGHLKRAVTSRSAARVYERGFVISTKPSMGERSVANAGTHQYGRTIKAKTAKGMRFRVGGTSRTNGPTWVRAQTVTIPKRQFMPEGELGPRWAKAFEKRADEVLLAALVDSAAGGR